VVDAARGASRVDRVVVATDDERIAVAGAAGGERASRERITPRARIAWKRRRRLGGDVVLNLQGDEPTLTAEAVDLLASAFDDPSVKMATLAIRGVTETERWTLTPRRSWWTGSATPSTSLGRRSRTVARGRRCGRSKPGRGGVEARRDAIPAAGARGVREGREERSGHRGSRAVARLSLGWKIRVVEVLDSPYVERPGRQPCGGSPSPGEGAR
jgi:hypothetical protein